MASEAVVFDERFFATMGRVLVAFNNLESSVRTRVGRCLTEHAGLGKVIVARVSFRDLTDMLEVISAFAFTRSAVGSTKGNRKEWEGIISELRQVNVLRNRLVHSAYRQQRTMLFNAETGESSEVPGSRTVVQERVTLSLGHCQDSSLCETELHSIDELVNICTRIELAHDRVLSLSQDLALLWANIPVEEE